MTLIENLIVFFVGYVITGLVFGSIAEKTDSLKGLITYFFFGTPIFAFWIFFQKNE